MTSSDAWPDPDDADANVLSSLVFPPAPRAQMKRKINNGRDQNANVLALLGLSPDPPGPPKRPRHAPKPPKEDPVPFDRSRLGSLPHEVLVSILCYLPPCANVSLTCKPLYHLTRDPSFVASYLCTYPKNQRLYWLVSFPKLCTPAAVDAILGRAHLSRYFLSVLTRCRAGDPPSWIKKQWGSGIPFLTFVHLLKLGEEHFGDISLAAHDDDASHLEAWIKSNGRTARGKKKVPRVRYSRGVLNNGPPESDPFQTIEELVRFGKFQTFAPCDPISNVFSYTCNVDDRIVPLLCETGYQFSSSEIQNILINTIMSSKSSVQSRINALQHFQSCHPLLCIEEPLIHTLLNGELNQVDMFDRSRWDQACCSWVRNPGKSSTMLEPHQLDVLCGWIATQPDLDFNAILERHLRHHLEGDPAHFPNVYIRAGFWLDLLSKATFKAPLGFIEWAYIVVYFTLYAVARDPDYRRHLQIAPSPFAPYTRQKGLDMTTLALLRSLDSLHIKLTKRHFVDLLQLPNFPFCPILNLLQEQSLDLPYGYLQSTLELAVGELLRQHNRGPHLHKLVRATLNFEQTFVRLVQRDRVVPDKLEYSDSKSWSSPFVIDPSKFKTNRDSLHFCTGSFDDPPTEPPVFVVNNTTSLIEFIPRIYHFNKAICDVLFVHAILAGYTVAIDRLIDINGCQLTAEHFDCILRVGHPAPVTIMNRLRLAKFYDSTASAPAKVEDTAPLRTDLRHRAPSPPNERMIVDASELEKWIAALKGLLEEDAKRSILWNKAHGKRRHARTRAHRDLVKWVARYEKDLAEHYKKEDQGTLPPWPLLADSFDLHPEIAWHWPMDCCYYSIQAANKTEGFA